MTKKCHNTDIVSEGISYPEQWAAKINFNITIHPAKQPPSSSPSHCRDLSNSLLTKQLSPDGSCKLISSSSPPILYKRLANPVAHLDLLTGHHPYPTSLNHSPNYYCHHLSHSRPQHRQTIHNPLFSIIFIFALCNPPPTQPNIYTTPSAAMSVPISSSPHHNPSSLTYNAPSHQLRRQPSSRNCLQLPFTRTHYPSTYCPYF